MGLFIACHLMPFKYFAYIHLICNNALTLTTREKYEEAYRF
jgi:hypothetical protein